MTKNSAASLKPLLTLSPSWLEIPACLSIASKQKRSGRGWDALQNGICPHAHPALPAHRPHSEVLQKAGSPPPGVPLACFFFTRVPYHGVGTESSDWKAPTVANSAVASLDFISFGRRGSSPASCF